MGLLDDAIREHLELKRRRGADPTEIARAEQEALGPVRRDVEAVAPPPAPEAHHDDAHDPHAHAAYEHDSHAPAPGAPHGDVAPPAADADRHAPPADEPPHREAAYPAEPPRHEPPVDDQTRILPREHAHEPGEPADAPRERAPEPPPAAPEPHGHGAEPSHPAARPAGADEHAAPPPAPAERRHDDPRHSDIVDQPTTEYRVEDHEELFPADEPRREGDRGRGDDAPPHRDAGHDAPHHDDEPDPYAAHASDEDVLEETPDFLQETPEHDRLWFEQRPPRDFDFDD